MSFFSFSQNPAATSFIPRSHNFETMSFKTTNSAIRPSEKNRPNHFSAQFSHDQNPLSMMQAKNNSFMSNTQNLNQNTEFFSQYPKKQNFSGNNMEMPIQQNSPFTYNNVNENNLFNKLAGNKNKLNNNNMINQSSLLQNGINYQEINENNENIKHDYRFNGYNNYNNIETNEKRTFNNDLKNNNNNINKLEIKKEEELENYYNSLKNKLSEYMMEETKRILSLRDRDDSDIGQTLSNIQINFAKTLEPFDNIFQSTYLQITEEMRSLQKEISTTIQDIGYAVNRFEKFMTEKAELMEKQIQENKNKFEEVEISVKSLTDEKFISEAESIKPKRKYLKKQK